jgi:hypothetical protein
MKSLVQEVQVHLLTLDRDCRDNDLALNTSYKPNALPMVRGYEGATHLRPQGLYITTDAKPRFEEWGFDGKKCILVGPETPTEGLRKIIASSPALLGIHNISDTFIRKYMVFYNEGYPITKAWVPLLQKERSVTMGDGSYSKETYEVEQTDDVGCLVVKLTEKKNSYSTEEVMDLLQKSYMCGYGDRDANLPTFSGLVPKEYLEEILTPKHSMFVR